MSIEQYISLSKLSREKNSEAFETGGQGYFYSHNGASSCVFHNGASIHYIGYVEFAPYRSRGNHFHKKKNEYMCVIRGNLKAKFVLPDRGDELLEMDLTEGDLIYVAAGCAHSYLSEAGAAVVEYSHERYEKSDTYKYSFFWENEIR